MGSDTRRKTSRTLTRGLLDASNLGLGGLVQDLFDDLVGLHTLGLAFEVEQHPVAQRRKAHLTHVVDRRREAPLEKRPDLGGEQHALRAAWRGAETHEAPRQL